MNDAQCLSELTKGGAANAFAQIVQRYAGLVYSTAQRTVRDAHLAEDVAQATFVTLLEKSSDVDARTLPGWLVTTTRYTAKRTIRSEARREKYEVRSALTRLDVVADEPTVDEIKPILDDALSELSKEDRTAVVMRFLQGHEFAKVGAALGSSEEAARKRVSRALEKLRGILMRQGVAPSVAGLTVALASQQARAAPAAVVRTILSAPWPSPAHGSAAAAKHGTVKLAAWSIAAVIMFAVGYFVAGSMPLAALSPPGPRSADPQFTTAARLVESPSIKRNRRQYSISPWGGRSSFAYHNPRGWPISLPGEACSTPVVADLLGDGHLEVIVACRVIGDPARGMPDGEPILFALTADGKVLANWPVALQEDNDQKPRPGEWTGSPSVFRRNGKDELVMVGAHAGIVVVKGDGSFKSISGDSVSGQTNIPLVDLDGDGIPDIAVGKYIGNVEGDDVKGWPPPHRFSSGLPPCVGDAFGDGRIELFRIFNRGGDRVTYLGGFDSEGHALVGWPRKIDLSSNEFAPSMGDVLGNGQMQIILAYAGQVFTFNPDGTPMPHTMADGPLAGILKSGVFAGGSPTLADLDGDGKAEIIVYDRGVHSIRAWHADGSSVLPAPKETSEPSMKRRAYARDNTPLLPQSDGFIAALPLSANAYGVSVASLGDDPKVMDFFAGTYWVRRFPDGRTTVTNLLPQDAPIGALQPTIADLEGSGKADVIYCTNDGSVFVYRTGLAYHADRMQWPTANGNFQHTGAWHKPASRP